MFTKLVLNNFKSFNRVSFDLTETINNPKKLLAIYGENGSGKSSIIDAFGILRLSLETVELTNEVNRINALMEEKDYSFIDTGYVANDYLRASQFSNLQRILSDRKTVDSEGDMTLEYSFLLNGSHRGKYILSFNSKYEITKEQLDYTINERIGNIFTIEKIGSDEIEAYLNKSIFLSKDIKNELLNRVEKIWGKHSFISIFKSMEEEFNKSYISSNVKHRFKEVVDFFLSISVSTESYTVVSQESCLLSDFIKGTIDSSMEEKIDNTQKLLYKYFSSLYVDIKDVFYKKDYESKEINYRLYLKKNVYGKLVDIPFTLESKGTKQLLDILPFFLSVIRGGVCFIDEIDNGIHDILMNHLLESLSEDINGQLVFTTHDTLMLKELPKQSVYFITIDYEGNKKVKGLRDYDNKVLSQNNSLQNQYLKGAFEGIPIPLDIDFDEISQIIQERSHE